MKTTQVLLTLKPYGVQANRNTTMTTKDIKNIINAISIAIGENTIGIEDEMNNTSNKEELLKLQEELNEIETVCNYINTSAEDDLFCASVLCWLQTINNNNFFEDK